MNRRSLIPTLLQVVVAVGILIWVIAVWGTGPFAAAAGVLTWPSVVGALALGAIGVPVQAQRWRLVARGQGIELGLRSSVERCWQAAFINAVLPGGLAGDAVRAIEERPEGGLRRSDTLKRSLGAVSAERLAGTSVVFLAAGVALLALRPVAGVLGLLVAAAAASAAWPWLRRLTARDVGLVSVLSVAGWCAFATLFLLACLAVAPGLPAEQIPVLAAITLAGMSIPLNVAGWGPREGAAALGFVLLGHSAPLGVGVSVGYGLLALVSVLPGGLVLLIRTLRGGWRRRARGGEIELGADIIAQHETAHGGGQRSGEGIGSVEADPGDAVAHQQRGTGEVEAVQGAGVQESGHG